jgi:hypothetical protein
MEIRIGRGLSRITSVFSCQYSCTNAKYSFLFQYYIYQSDKRQYSGNLLSSDAFDVGGDERRSNFPPTSNTATIYAGTQHSMSVPQM